MHITIPARIAYPLLLAAVSILAASCQSTAPTSQTASVAQSEPAAPALPPQTYATPDDALRAFKTAATSPADSPQMEDVFGSGITKLESADKIQASQDQAALAKSINEAAKLEKQDDNTFTVLVGKDEWPFPIPLIKSTENRWYFDTSAGEQEILDRRVGENELTTIRMMKAYVEAQRNYARSDRTGAGIPTYAERFHSTPGKHDGLYWETAPDETPSPFGPLIAEEPAGSTAQTTQQPGRKPYYGYYYKVLKSQGPGAPGGAYNYEINGNMIAGFAAIAWPAQYGNTGVMTFIISHTGTVYQKDLGPDTAKTARATKTYDPAGWEEAEK
jgi:hypothetical protein